MVSNISSPFSFVLGPADVVFIDCVAGVGKGRGRELGKATVFRASLFRSNFSANKTTPPCRSLVSVSPSRIKKTEYRIQNSIYRRASKVIKSSNRGTRLLDYDLSFIVLFTVIVNN